MSLFSEETLNQIEHGTEDCTMSIMVFDLEAKIEDGKAIIIKVPKAIHLELTSESRKVLVALNKCVGESYPSIF
ncbi:MAG: hypothetical protein A3F72_19675 [Bacteroidetes bacterium RIFCSPLOWO2_12_FULL_35_15]|nr:MAG: hypothetical protein A3F72_19675 [Bacteroidetes bacterium RIFCSPLOWO2_12_FULL_35_15]